MFAPVVVAKHHHGQDMVTIYLSLRKMIFIGG